MYSLGVMLYELLTGTLPYALDGGPLDLLDRLRRGHAAQPSSLRRAVGRELDTIVGKATHVESARRYDTAGGLADDLRRLLTGRPILARRPTALYRLRKLAARNRAIAVTVATSFVLLLAALVATSALLVRAVRAERLAETRRVVANDEAAKAKAYSTFLARMLVSADPEVARGRDVAILREMLDEFAERSRTELADLPEVQAGVQRTLGETYVSLSLYERAVPLLASSAALHAELYGAEDPRRAEVLLTLASARHYLSDPDAVNTAREAIALLSRARGPDHPDVAGAQCGLADMLTMSGHIDVQGAEARRLTTAATASLLATLGPDDARTLDALTVHGRVLLAVGALDEAETVLHDVAERRLALHGPESIEAATDALILGKLLIRRGRFDDAEAPLEHGLAIRRRLLGPGHFALAWPLENLARVRVHQARYAEAEALAREALDVYRRSLTEDAPQVLVARGDLAGVLLAAGRRDEALSILDATLPPLRAGALAGED